MWKEKTVNPRRKCPKCGLLIGVYGNKSAKPGALAVHGPPQNRCSGSKTNPETPQK